MVHYQMNDDQSLFTYSDLRLLTRTVLSFGCPVCKYVLQ